MDTTELVYCYNHQHGRQNLSALVLRDADGNPRIHSTPLYIPPSVPDLPSSETLENFLAQYPKARITPPFRVVQIDIVRTNTVQLNPLDELVMFLPDGIFIGFIMRLDSCSTHIELTAHEAIPVLVEYDAVQVINSYF